MRYTTATVKVGSPERGEWTNVGVLIYDNERPDCPLVAQRFVTDWKRVVRRSEGLRVPADELERWAKDVVDGYATYDRVKRGGYPGSFIQVHPQGASIEPNLQEVTDEFYDWCCYDPTRECHKERNS